MNYLPKLEISFDNWEDAARAIEVLTKYGDKSHYGYVTMVSREEDLYILNCIESDGIDRNDVVFMTIEDFEELTFSDPEEDDYDDFRSKTTPEDSDKLPSFS